ncbi:condensation domain-containing protein [Actinacidiphila acididurans]|uniref:Carrier domain-containing protein n=1 Tax=Actinacidiphila acididurans TaxID=2784346 RepID=A0ABS2TU16_9ACTN|nr:condensation domain-containing protein [Actinacidiphila acididurans]MBM9506829.1 hypothetical protein [Actinacidiphila acididurans]
MQRHGHVGTDGTRTRRLSFAQEQLWFLDQLTPGNAYNVLMVWRLRGPLHTGSLHRALNLVVARHEALRVTFSDDDGTPYQVVAPPATVPLTVTDLRGLSTVEREERVRAEIEARRSQPYDLRTGPLCRFGVIRTAEEEYVFYQGYHHIITDGWSTSVVNAELSAAYRAFESGAEPVFEETRLDYTEYAEAQRERLHGAVLDEEVAFWRQKLAGLPVLELPHDRPRPAGEGGHRGASLVKGFPADVRAAVRRLADEQGVSMFMVLAAAYAVVLGRWTGLEDLPVGVPMPGRPDPELESLVGMFINMVVLRSDLSGDPTFGELVERVADGVLELYDHEELPFNQVVDAVQPVREPNRNPLFQVSLQLLGASVSGEELAFPAVTAEIVTLDSVSSRFDISVSIVDDGSALRAGVEYSADMFDRWRMEAMLDHLEAVLLAAAADPDQRLSAIPLVTGEAAERLLAAGRGDLPPAVAGAPVSALWAGLSAADRQAYVVDRALGLVPPGVPGELLVAVPEPGGGTSAGMPVADPFRPGRWAVRTGVRVRWTPDLRLERADRPAQGSFSGADPARPEGAVPAGEADTAGADRDAPRTATEKSVAGIFGEVLALPEVGAEDSFFDIGGNSLQAMRAVSRINRGFGIKLSVRALYGNATVRAVSSVVDEKVKGESA